MKNSYYVFMNPFIGTTWKEATANNGPWYYGVIVLESSLSASDFESYALVPGEYETREEANEVVQRLSNFRDLLHS